MDGTDGCLGTTCINRLEQPKSSVGNVERSRLNDNFETGLDELRSMLGILWTQYPSYQTECAARLRDMPLFISGRCPTYRKEPSTIEISACAPKHLSPRRRRGGALCCYCCCYVMACADCRFGWVHCCRHHHAVALKINRHAAVEPGCMKEGRSKRALTTTGLVDEFLRLRWVSFRPGIVCCFDGSLALVEGGSDGIFNWLTYGGIFRCRCSTRDVWWCLKWNILRQNTVPLE